MTPPNKKRKAATKKPSRKLSPVLPSTSESAPIPSIPDDLLLNCFARVSKLYYPILSLASKRFDSLLTSPTLYQNRSLLGRTTESCLYVCLKFSPASNPRWFPRWFTLCRRPNQTDTSKKKKSSGYALAPVSIPNLAPWGTTVAIDSNIYSIGSSLDKSHSSSVSILDCRTHTWHEAPSMKVERNHPAVNVYDGKIYVAGGFEGFNSSNWMEVFDPETQAWKFVYNSVADSCCSLVRSKSAVIEGEIYLFGGEKNVVYKPKKDRWRVIRGLNYFNLGWGWLSYCVVDNILYSYNDSDEIEWFDANVGYWVSLKGLEGLPDFDDYKYVRLVDYGGKIAVLWNEYVPSSENRMIWCAVIALERRNSEEIWGNIEWFDVVLEVPKSFEFVSVLSVTV